MMSYNAIHIHIRIDGFFPPCRGFAVGAGATALSRLAAGFPPSRGMDWPKEPEDGDLGEGLIVI